MRAIVEAAGGIDDSYVSRIIRMPPVLILHRDEDTRVPVEYAKRLETLLKKMGVEHETRIYEGEGHLLSTGALLDAATRAILFLRRHL